MNTRLRSSLSALAIVVGVFALGFALGEPPRPAALAERGADERPMASTSRIHLAMPFFSFGKRVSAGVP